ncbi:MAG: hypothetical protein H7175_23620 [Burkholderiales bacterium]|nr:hypothetical protein [Anaerolineae bacterium]
MASANWGGGAEKSAATTPGASGVSFSDAVAAREANPFGLRGSYGSKSSDSGTPDYSGMLDGSDFGGSGGDQPLLKQLIRTQAMRETRWTQDQQIAFDVTEQMAYAAGSPSVNAVQLLTDITVGAAKGLNNLIPETAAFAYRMSGYAIAGVVSKFNTDWSDQMFAKYERVTGRLFEYDNGVQEFSGMTAQALSPLVTRGAAAAGSALYNTEIPALWAPSAGRYSPANQAGAINFGSDVGVRTVSAGEALRAKYAYMTIEQRGVRLDQLAEGNAYRRLQEIESSIPGAHFLEKHGAQTTLQSQLERAQYGANPSTGIVETYANGSAKIPSSATRFLSNRDQMNAIDRAQNIYRLTGDATLAERPINFNYLIGEGYKKTSLTYGQSYSAQVWFRQGNVNTAFPIWGQ